MQIKDGDWILFDYDIQTGRQVWVHHNDDGSDTFRVDYPADSTIALNQAQRNMARPDWKGDYHQIASIPLNIYHQQLADAAREGDEKYLARWLNDSDNRAWRTKEGNV